MLKKILNRLYANFLMPSRMDDFEFIINASLEAGYKHITLPEYYRLLTLNKLDGKYFLHRHDIDTDTSTARAFFSLEKKFNIKSSYYFRLNTIDWNFMNEINAYGSEVGYHYEELATYCKRHKIKNSSVLEKHTSEIQDEFSKNLEMINSNLRFKIKSIASHGDFANRLLNTPNYYFINKELLIRNEIAFECYDKKLTDSYSIAISDAAYPDKYRPISPIEAIRNSEKVIHFLTHPRHWRCSPLSSFKEDFTRLIEGLKYYKI